LPVEFLFFEAKRFADHQSLIEWATASEINSDYFEVQRSLDQQTWTSIATVNAAGNSNDRLYYNQIDEKALDGTNYYRIKQVDIDGSAIFTEVKSVSFESDGLWSIYPNPALDRVTISTTGGSVSIKSIVLFSSQGEMLQRFNFENESSVLEIYLGDYAAGSYLLQIETASSTFHAKLQKVN